MITLSENAENKHKFIYYSAHDSTIMALLVVLHDGNNNKMDYNWPQFGANLTIELWKREEDKSDKAKNDSYFLRVYYMGKVC